MVEQGPEGSDGLAVGVCASGCFLLGCVGSGHGCDGIGAVGSVCQWPLVSARRRPAEMPAGGHENWLWHTFRGAGVARVATEMKPYGRTMAVM